MRPHASGYGSDRRHDSNASMTIRALLLALLLSGCATLSPNARTRAALERAGLRAPVAACMADRMTAQLSLLQLRRLSALGGLSEDARRGMFTEQLLHRVRALGDPEIVSVTGRAAIACALR